MFSTSDLPNDHGPHRPKGPVRAVVFPFFSRLHILFRVILFAGTFLPLFPAPTGAGVAAFPKKGSALSGDPGSKMLGRNEFCLRNSSLRSEFTHLSVRVAFAPIGRIAPCLHILFRVILFAGAFLPLLPTAAGAGVVAADFYEIGRASCRERV